MTAASSSQILIFLKKLELVVLGSEKLKEPESLVV
jgi:hypothetical protein